MKQLITHLARAAMMHAGTTMRRTAVMLVLAVLTVATAWAHGSVTKDGKTYTVFTGSTTSSFYTLDADSLPPNSSDSDELPDKLFDGSSYNKWCYVSEKYYVNSPNWKNLIINFHTSEPIVLKGYRITVADDVQTYQFRNPRAWKLYGATSANGKWTLLDEQTYGGLPTSLYDPKKDFYVTENATSYQYFRYEITEVMGTGMSDNYDNGAYRYKCQLGEFQLIGTTATDYANNLTNCSLSGLQPTYNYTGNNISVNFTVKDGFGKTISSSNYTTSFSPGTIKNPGLYTMTISGKGSCSGSKNFTFRVVKHLSGNGTEESPYLINNVTDWDAFVDYVNNENGNYGDKVYKLCADLNNVTTMVGTDDAPFKGNFDGDGHTLNVNLSSDSKYCAPFRYISHATVRNLHVTGTITAGSETANEQNKFRGGLVGRASGIIRNCRSSVTINSQLSSEGSHGGLVAHSWSPLEIYDCLFDGKITGSTTTNCGGFIGYNDTPWLEIYNCLMAGQLDIDLSTGNSATFGRHRSRYDFDEFVNNYYVTAYGTEQGTAVGTMTNDSLRAHLGIQWEIRNGKVVPIMDTKNVQLGSVECENNYMHTGSSIVLTPVVKDRTGKLLTKDVDYSISYSPSPVVDINDYTMIISGIGEYRGKQTFDFSVTGLPAPMYIDEDYAEGKLGHYAVNIPETGTAKLDLAAFNFKSSFKVYDNGGKAGNAVHGTGCLRIVAPEGYLIRLSGQHLDNHNSDLNVFDGNTADFSTSIGKAYKPEGDIGTFTSTGNEMLIKFYANDWDKPDQYINPGVDLNVSLVDASTVYGITVNEATTGGGSVSVNPTSAASGNDVTMTVTPAEGYKLCDLNATDAFGNRTFLSHLLWYNTTPGTFKMTSSAMTITPTFTNDFTAEGGLYVNMLKHSTADAPLTVNIPANVESLKIYDDGGKDSICGYNSDSYLLLTAPAGYRLSLFGTVKLYYNDNDGLEIFDGNTTATRLFKNTDSNQAVELLESTGNQLLLHIMNSTSNYNGIDLKVRLFRPSTENSITVENTTNGTVTSSLTKAKYGDEVTLSISRNTGYALESLVVKDIDGNEISTGEWNWGNVGTSLTFTMPATSVTITPTFSDYPYINMKKGHKTLDDAEVLNIPADIRHFRVYDDGGKDGKNSSSYEGYLLLNAPEGYRMKMKGSVELDSYSSYYQLKIYDGNNTASTVTTHDYNNKKAEKVSTGNQMLLYFEGPYAYSGFNLDVNSFNPEADKTITVKQTLGGTVTPSVTKAKYDEEVTLTITPNEDHFLQSMEVKDIDGNTVNNTDFNWYKGGNTPSFNMVETDVTVTPNFVDMPYYNMVNSSLSNAPTINIPAGVTKFKVYDDGGKDSCSSNYFYGYVKLAAPQGRRLKVTGTVKVYGGEYNDYLTVYDGHTTSKWIGSKRYWGTMEGENIGAICSSDSLMLLYFRVSTGADREGLDLTVTVYDPEDSNTITVVNPEKGGTIETAVTEAKPGDKVIVTHTANDSYYLEGLDIKDTDGLSISTNDWAWYTPDSALYFTMPAAAVTVIPLYTRMPSVKMPKSSTSDAPRAINIPDNVVRLKVYDDGGKDGNYSSYCSGYLLLTAPEGTTLQIDGTVKTEDIWDDYLIVYDGGTTDKRLGDSKYGGSSSSSSCSLTTTGNKVLLFFRSNYSYEDTGLDLTVSVINTNADFGITVNNPEQGGTVAASAETAKYNDTITVTAQQAGDYLLKDWHAQDFSGCEISVTGGLWYDTVHTGTFVMPSSDVTITPEFTDDKTLDAGLYVNMVKTSTLAEPMQVTIPEGLKAFKIYDDGGKDGNSSSGCNAYVLLSAPEGHVLKLTGTIDTYDDSYNSLKVYDGTTNSTQLGDGYYRGSNKNIGVLKSSGNNMLLYFRTNSYSYRGLDLTLEVLDVNDVHTVNVKDSVGGKIIANPATAKGGTEVTLNVVPTNATWMLNELTVLDEDSLALNVTDALWYTGNTAATFTMPYADVNVTSAFVNNWTAEGGLYVNMPSVANTATTPKTVTIPTGVASFKVYDDGGKDSKTNGKGKNYMLLTAPEGYLLQLTGKVKGSSSYCNLTVYDGESENATNRLGKEKYGHNNNDGEDVGALYSTGNKMLLYFNNTSRGYDGLDLTVTLVSATVEHTVTVNNPTTGSNKLTATPTLAVPNTQIALNPETATGYFLEKCTATDEAGYAVKVTGGAWYDNADATFFSMPPSNVTVTPSFTNALTAEDGLCVNMEWTGDKAANALKVNVPDNVTSFKIYDDGGKNGYSSQNFDGCVLITAPEGRLIRLTGSVPSSNYWTYLDVYEGDSKSTNKRLGDNSFRQNANVGELVCANQMLLYFYNSSATDGNLDLTATILPADTKFNVVVNNPEEGGVVEVDKTEVSYNEQVTLTAKPAKDYIIASVTAKDEAGNVVALLDWMSGTTTTFSMPASTVTVTPVFSKNPTAENGLYVNMEYTGYNATDAKVINVSEGVQSFAIYDNGGKDGKYSNSFDGYLLITAPEDNIISLTGTVTSENGCDYLTVYDGSTTDNSLGNGSYGNSNTNGEDIGTLTSTGNQMLLYFHSDYSVVKDGLNLKATITPCLTLANDSTNNSSRVYLNNEKETAAVLKGRTLYKDGKWNTICLPFNVDLTDVNCPLYGADARELEEAYITGDEANGHTLHLTFSSAVTTLEAGVPYIIKWESGSNITDPVFTDVTVDNTDNGFDSGSGDYRVRFLGTYDKTVYAGKDKSVLFMGSSNNLYYPDGEASVSLGACRAYFKIGDDAHCAKSFVGFDINFGEESTGIDSTTDSTEYADDADTWYTIDGIKLDVKPSKKGMYIHNGKTVVVE
ncbi:MAG: hypothetical protein II844_08420 [Prevotella sp.]|nr:hypothetical protein [Prevotella sp.]